MSECSVLEPGRTLTLAEKAGAGAEVITAAPGFRLVATMNPGGDYGKKELSPALSNRFTQIWVPAIEDNSELAAIIQSRITGMLLLHHALSVASSLGWHMLVASMLLPRQCQTWMNCSVRSQQFTQGSWSSHRATANSICESACSPHN